VQIPIEILIPAGLVIAAALGVLFLLAKETKDVLVNIDARLDLHFRRLVELEEAVNEFDSRINETSTAVNHLLDLELKKHGVDVDKFNDPRPPKPKDLVFTYGPIVESKKKRRPRAGTARSKK
jgi:hypothetical protein